jgi:hypothetical protein
MEAERISVVRVPKPRGGGYGGRPLLGIDRSRTAYADAKIKTSYDKTAFGLQRFERCDGDPATSPTADFHYPHACSAFSKDRKSSSARFLRYSSKKGGESPPIPFMCPPCLSDKSENLRLVVRALDLSLSFSSAFP